MTEILNVVFTIDENFIQHFSVTAVSLLRNNRDIQINIYVINNIKDLSLLSNVKKFILKKYNTKLNIIKVEDSIFSQYKISHHISKAVYFRLLLADILPDTIDKILYLDSDLVITDTLKELFELPFNNNYILAVDDGELDNIKTIPRLNNIGIPITSYFNSGVMWINLKAWRTDNISKKLVGIANDYMDRILWWDQDILNICFLNRWGRLSDKFNKLQLTEKCKQIPTIIHYNTHSKPWHYLNYHPYKYLYWKYIKQTPFKGSTFKDFTYKRFLKKLYYKFKNKQYTE